LIYCLFHLTKGERAREKTRQNVYDLSSRRRDHLIHPVGDDIASTRKDYLGVRTSSDQTGDSAGFMDRDLLIALQGVLVTTDLCDDSVAQPQSLVAMLLHIFDLILSSFRNVDGAHCFEETEGDDGVDSAGHLVVGGRAQANRRPKCLQAGKPRSRRLNYKRGTRTERLACPRACGCAGFAS